MVSHYISVGYILTDHNKSLSANKTLFLKATMWNRSRKDRIMTNRICICCRVCKKSLFKVNKYSFMLHVHACTVSVCRQVCTTNQTTADPSVLETRGLPDKARVCETEYACVCIFSRLLPCIYNSCCNVQRWCSETRLGLNGARKGFFYQECNHCTLRGQRPRLTLYSHSVRSTLFYLVVTSAKKVMVSALSVGLLICLSARLCKNCKIGLFVVWYFHQFLQEWFTDHQKKILHIWVTDIYECENLVQFDWISGELAEVHTLLRALLVWICLLCAQRLHNSVHGAYCFTRPWTLNRRVCIA